MLNMFNLKNVTSALGLDISDLGIKLVQLKTLGDKTKIQGLSKIKLNKGIIENGEILEVSAVIKALHDLMSKPTFGSFSGNEVVASLPETKTFIKLIAIEKTPNNLAKVVDAEFEKHIPYQANEVYYDWQLVRELPDAYLVLIGAAPKNIVNQYLDILKKAKLSINALEIEAMPICRSLLKEESRKWSGQYEKNYCLLDIGARRSSVIIYAKDSIALSLSIPLSGDAITTKISETLQIKLDQAEKAKIVCGLDKSQAHGIVSDLLSDMIKNLTKKILTAVDFFGKHYPKYGPIDEILLTGGGSNIRNLNNIMTEATGIPTRDADSLINLDEKTKADSPALTEVHKISMKDLKKGKGKDTDNLTVKQDASRSFATAIGLALRNLTLKEM